MSKLRIFMDGGSQPSRAVWWFTRLNNIPAEMQVVQIMKGETKSPEFKAMDPRGQVPVMQEDDFILTESHAILRYLSQKYATPDHWYPADLRARARVDEYLDMHHSFLRRGAGGIVFNTCFLPLIKPEAVSEATIADAKRTLKFSLKLLDARLNKHHFLAGDEMSIADLSAFCEIEQLKIIKYPYTQEHPGIARWCAQMEALPYHDDVNKVLDIIVKRFSAKF